MDRHIRTYRIFNNQIHKLGNHCRRIRFPGSRGLTIYEVISLFLKGLSKGSLNIRATSIAFHFLLALGPAIIFLLGLIPYMPVQNFQQGIMEILVDIIPQNSYIALESLLVEIFQKHHGLQIVGFLVTLFFVQKGLNGIIEAFNGTYHVLETRPWIERRLISVGLFIILFILVTLAAILLFLSNLGIKYLFAQGIIKAYATYSLLLLGKWLIVLALTFIAISFLYYLAPSRKTRWRFFTPGSIVATLLSILTSIGFSYFVNHFAPFNRFYGSIGTLIALMLWMNFNALALLAGFELNISIKNARFRKFEPTVI
ncbi:MAG TPA: YihY/virulence factor BrkB family protein [Bacteroidales bacterium]|nr:YihY/virulence factor BrkB family protein [Bacteroidales bacterium]